MNRKLYLHAIRLVSFLDPADHKILITVLTFVFTCFLGVSTGSNSAVAQCTMSGNPSSGNAPLAVQFSTIGLPDGVPFSSISLDPGDGSPEIALIIPMTNYTYQQSGQYEAVLTAVESSGTVHTCSTTIEVSEIASIPLAPELTFTEKESGVFSFAVAVKNGTPPYIYQYDFGDAGFVQSESATASHTYQSPGDYQAKVTVTDAEGNTGEASATVTVVFPCLLVGSPSAGNAPLTVQFKTDGMPEGVRFSSISLDPGDGSGAISLIVPLTDYTYPKSGNYEAVLTAVESGGTEHICSTKIEVAEALPLTPALTATEGNAPGVIRFTVALEDGTSPYTYVYNFGDGTRPIKTINATQEYTYSEGGDYQTTVTVMDANGNSGSASTTVNVVGQLTLYLTSDVDRGTTPLSVSFFPKIKGGVGPYTFDWDFGDATTGSEEQPVHVYADHGNFPCQLTVTDAEGTQVAANLQISVISLVAIHLIPDELTLAFKGDTAHIRAEGIMSDGTTLTPQGLTMLPVDPVVVSIDGSIVQAEGEGTTQITATVGDITATAEVTAYFQPVSIEVEDFFKLLKLEQTYKPRVYAIYQNGSQQEIIHFTLAAKMGDAFVRIEDQTIVGVAGGFGLIEVTYRDRTAETLVEVSDEVPLNLVPQKLRVKAGKKETIVISGGKPPYVVTEGALDDTGTNWILTAPETPGEYTFTVTDDEDNKVSLAMSVFAPLGIIKTGETADTTPIILDLSATGGTPPYQWVASAGELSVTETADETIPVAYTQPEIQGTYTITVTDVSGQSADYYATTYAEMFATPTLLYLAPEAEYLIRVVGGIPPYTATADAGTVTDRTLAADPNVLEQGFLYKAPDVVGQYTLTIKDQTNAQRTVTINVNHPLWVTPQKVYLDRNESREFQILGGIGGDAGMTIKALVGEVPAHPENQTFTYTAPDVTGADTLIVTDNSGQDVSVHIQVTSNYYFVTPSNAALLRGENRLFRTVGGTGDNRTWTAKYGELTTDSEKQKSTLYTAQDQLVKDLLSAKDEEGQEVTAKIHIMSDRVLITPQQVFLGPNESTTFRALFGTESYEFVVTDGTIAALETDAEGQATKINYTAPSRPGEYFVSVYDTAGNIAKARVTVSGGHVKTSPPIPTMKEILYPVTEPNSFDQPVGVGNIQVGGTHFRLATDFPNYKKEDGSPLPMNYYLLMNVVDANLWFVFTMEGEILLPSQLRPFASNITDMVYTSVFEFDLCMPDYPLAVDIYALAIASEYDPSGMLAFEPADAPYELWHLTFQIHRCK